jgi:hypothetical protein
MTMNRLCMYLLIVYVQYDVSSFDSIVKSDPLISCVWSLALTFQIELSKAILSTTFTYSTVIPMAFFIHTKAANLIPVTNTSRFTDVTWRISNEAFQMRHFKVKPVPSDTPISQFNKPVVLYFSLHVFHTISIAVTWWRRLHQELLLRPKFHSILPIQWHLSRHKVALFNVILSRTYYGSYNNFSFHELFVAISRVSWVETYE